MTSYAVPNVGTMTSTGLTQDALAALWQDLVLQCLGITPTSASDAAAYSQVRIDWPNPGQPGFTISDDVAFIQITEVPDSYNYAHETQPGTTTGTTFTESTIYTRVWGLNFTFYGPNSFDHARQVKACLYQDFAHETLAASNLYLQMDIGTPSRNPELFQNQWWDRTSFNARLNEQVTDTLTKQTIQIVEVILEDENGIFSDVVVGS